MLFLHSINQINGEEIPHKEKRKKKRWFLRPTGIFVILLSAGVIIISYLSPQLEDNVAMSVIVMLVRSLVITFVWYLLLAPIARKLFQKFVTKRKSQYSKELEDNNFYVSKVQVDCKLLLETFK